MEILEGLRSENRSIGGKEIDDLETPMQEFRYFVFP